MHNSIESTSCWPPWRRRRTRLRVNSTSFTIILAQNEALFRHRPHSDTPTWTSPCNTLFIGAL